MSKKNNFVFLCCDLKQTCCSTNHQHSKVSSVVTATLETPRVVHFGAALGAPVIQAVVPEHTGKVMQDFVRYILKRKETISQFLIEMLSH